MLGRAELARAELASAELIRAVREQAGLDLVSFMPAARRGGTSSPGRW